MRNLLQCFIATFTLTQADSLNVCKENPFRKSSVRLMKSTCMTVAMLTCLSSNTFAMNEVIQNSKSSTWYLPNGEVELTNPLTSFGQYKLTDPFLLGSGGGGAVFSTTPLNDRKGGIAVKISWVRSAASVERECSILNELERANTRNVERCVGIERYPVDSRRVMVALEPVVRNEVASVDKVDQNAQASSVQCIARTLVDMLGANIVTTDVQPLMDKESGSVLFIDMTEAKRMSNPPSFLDLALASSFCAEMAALIPESLADVASMTFLNELQAAHTRGIFLPIPIYEILQDSIFSNRESAELIESTIKSLRK